MFLLRATDRVGSDSEVDNPIRQEPDPPRTRPALRSGCSRVGSGKTRIKNYRMRLRTILNRLTKFVVIFVIIALLNQCCFAEPMLLC